MVTAMQEECRQNPQKRVESGIPADAGETGEQRGAESGDGQNGARPEAVGDPAARAHENRVAEQECRVHLPHVRWGDAEFLHDRRTGNGHDRAVEITQAAEGDHQGDGNPLGPGKGRSGDDRGSGDHA